MGATLSYFGRGPAEQPPDTMSQRIHDQAQSLSSDLRRFRRDWPYFPQLEQFEYVVSNDLLASLNQLATDLAQFRYAAPTSVVPDQQWCNKLRKLQESIRARLLQRRC